MRPTATTKCQVHSDPELLQRVYPRPDPVMPPLCSREQLRSAVEVGDLGDEYFEGAHYGQRVLIRGRSILGGVCCRGCWGGCGVAIALDSGSGTDATPGAGRMVFLTALEAARQRAAFDDALRPTFAQSCPWSNGSYCCRSPRRLGRDVVVTGALIAPPDVKPGPANEINCQSEFRSMPPPLPWPRCEFTVPWRSEIDEVAAVAVESVCQVPAD